MDKDIVGVVIETFKEKNIDLVVTLPEEPTYPLTNQILCRIIAAPS